MTSFASSIRIANWRDLRVVAALAGVAVMVRLFGVRRALALLAPIARLRGAPLEPGQHIETARKLARRIAKVADGLPAPPRCLVRSILLATVLRRRGIAAEIQVGVRMDDGFTAHAWVEVHGVVVNDTHAEIAAYRRLWSAPQSR